MIGFRLRPYRLIKLETTENDPQFYSWNNKLRSRT
jgi:hypothetical protein